MKVVHASHVSLLLAILSHNATGAFQGDHAVIKHHYQNHNVDRHLLQERRQEFFVLFKNVAKLSLDMTVKFVSQQLQSKLHPQTPVQVGIPPLTTPLRYSVICDVACF